MNPNAEPFVPRNRITSNGPTNQAGYFLSVPPQNGGAYFYPTVSAAPIGQVYCPTFQQPPQYYNLPQAYATSFCLPALGTIPYCPPQQTAYNNNPLYKRTLQPRNGSTSSNSKYQQFAQNQKYSRRPWWKHQYEGRNYNSNKYNKRFEYSDESYDDCNCGCHEVDGSRAELDDTLVGEDFDGQDEVQG